MKHLLIFTMLLFAFNIQAENKTRKVSNSNYYVCDIERGNVGKKNFKRQYIFAYPTENGESHELKASMRWNKVSVTFDNKGTVSAVISERVGSEMIEATKKLQLEKEPQFESFKMIVEVKATPVIPYTISCRPE